MSVVWSKTALALLEILNLLCRYNKPLQLTLSKDGRNNITGPKFGRAKDVLRVISFVVSFSFTENEKGRAAAAAAILTRTQSAQMPRTLCYLSNLAQKTRQISAHGLDLAQGLSAETRCFWQDSAWSQTMSPILHIKAQTWNFSKDHQKPDKHILLSDSTKTNQFGSKGLPRVCWGFCKDHQSKVPTMRHGARRWGFAWVQKRAG